MEILVIQKDDLREENGLLAVLLALSASSDIQHRDGSQLREFAGTGSCGHGDEGIVSAAASNGIEFILPALEALFELSHDIRVTLCFRSRAVDAEARVFLNIFFIGFLCVRLEDQIDAGDGKSAVLLAGSAQNDIADDIEGNIQRFGLIVPDITHLKAAGKDILYIKQTAVHGISSGGHVVHIDIAVTAGLDLLGRHEEFLIQLLIELIENQTSLGCDQSGVGVGILFIADVHDGLALLIHIIQHADKVLLIVAVIPVALRNQRLNLLQSALHDVVHDGNRNLIRIQLIHLVDHILTDMSLVFLGKFRQGSVCTFPDSVDHLLYIERFLAAVLLDHIHMAFRYIFLAVRARMFC